MMEEEDTLKMVGMVKEDMQLVEGHRTGMVDILLVRGYVDTQLVLDWVDMKG